MFNPESIIKKEGEVENLSDAEFRNKLIPIYHTLQSYSNLEEGLKRVRLNLLKLLNVSQFTIYQNVLNGKELRSYFRAGPVSDQRDLDMTVPFSPTSPAGYVALNHRPVLIANVNDQEKLTNIHPQLRWQESFRNKSKVPPTKSVIVVPIKDEILLGVLQLETKDGHPGLTKRNLSQAEVISQILAKLFRASLQISHGPYDYLIQMRKLSSDQLDDVKKSVPQDSSKIPKILMEDYGIEADDIGESLECYYRVPYMKYDASVTLPPYFMDKIETNYLRNNLWLPIAGDKEEVVILIDDPSDQERIFEIDKIINARNYVIKVGLPEHILQYLEEETNTSDVLGNSFDKVFKILEDEDYGAVEQKSDKDEEERLAATSAIIQLVKRIIIEADRLGSSDIHIEPSHNRAPGIVRVRVDGICRVLQEIPHEYMAALITRIKVIAGMDISERRLTQDGKCKEIIRGRTIELRVATFPTSAGESAVLRILPRESVMPLEKLSLSAPNLKRIQRLASNLHGMFLVVGPTGAGKTVTLHAILGYLNKPEVKIWTVEDPIEITQPGLQQLQVKPKIGLTFASAMRGFLRGDPDVILIGEMRDNETASVAVEASLTGHLVLSTLHSNSAPETITRLLNLGMEPVNFSDALLGIMAQRLIRTLCNNCKESYEPTAQYLSFLIDGYGEECFPELELKREDIRLCRPVGCDQCENSGYAGRIGVHELLVITSELQQMIYHQAVQRDIREQAIKDGMRTLKQDGIHKIFLGLTDYEQLCRIVAE